jgi:parallel beta-helix repeat protein
MHRALIIALAVGVLLSFGAENAFATHVGCGDLVTTDVRLDSDLVGCPGPGLVVGADDITIDLRGHTIAGADLAGAGVDDTGQHDRLVIENGTITGFYDGVFLNQSSGSAVRRLEISHVFQGVELLDSPENAVERNSISDATSGGISVEGESDRNRVEKNSVLRAGAGVQLSPAVELTRTPDDNLIVKNELAPGGIGVALSTALRNRVEKNVFHDNATNVFVQDADGNVIERNDMIRGGLGTILIDSDDNRLSRNRVEELFVGILVLDGSQGTILERNVASRNQDDGIKVLAASTTLTGNVANDNGDLGIDAVPGVIDGGGNRASGNGNPAQCVNVACR